jgi:hypothetical protein
MMFFFADGRRYEGAFKNCDFHAFGSMFHPDGRRWAGQWRDNKQVESEGQWLYTWADAAGQDISGDVEFMLGWKQPGRSHHWEGGWENGQPHGHGVLFSADNRDRFVGECVNGKFEGDAALW